MIGDDDENYFEVEHNENSPIARSDFTREKMSQGKVDYWKTKQSERSQTIVSEFKGVHGNKYDISKVKNIKTRDDKILIGCSKHGEFSRIVSNFASGSGCSLCLEDAKKSRGYKKPHPSLSQEKVIDRFKKVHGNRYDYSKVNYVNGGTKVIIICKEHGEFKTTPHIHKGGSNCKKCTDSNRRKGYKGSSQ